MKSLIILFSFMSWWVSWPEGHPTSDQQKLMIDSVNKIRQKGCYCGKRFMKPVQKIEWNDKLYQSAHVQASEMYQHNFFAHFSKEGLNIGERLEKAGYIWMVAGENLGEGQKSFEEVLNDWLASYSHCTMLMHPKVEEMAVAKVDKYWVQHFGKQMPLKN
ncbi:MAG: CAP domain-containing protein [Saprospiraceae bacterium]|jgi:uncharacterized protein YkwD|nr:CAP domain-containing protein [Saprospiraceae bacterium]